MSKKDKVKDEIQCCICTELVQDKNYGCLECKHVFHFGCIEKWLKRSQTCPICRNDSSSVFDKDKKEIKIKLDSNLKYELENTPSSNLRCMCPSCCYQRSHIKRVLDDRLLKKLIEDAEMEREREKLLKIAENSPRVLFAKAYF